MQFLHKRLVTNYGEVGYKTGGGHVKFYPYEKGGGGRKSFSHAEGVGGGGGVGVGGGGGITSVGVVFKRGVQNEGGGAKSFGPMIFPFCSPPPHNE